MKGGSDEDSNNKAVLRCDERTLYQGIREVSSLTPKIELVLFLLDCDHFCLEFDGLPFARRSSDTASVWFRFKLYVCRPHVISLEAVGSGE